MARVNWRASNLLNPLPVVLITCSDETGKSNVMTAAWAGTICSDPVMISVSIRKSRYSHDIIARTKQFVVNLTNQQLALFTDYAGIYSGKKVDKLAENNPYNIHTIPAEKIDTVTIAESPLALECEVKQILELGSHDMFIAEVVNVSVDEKYLDEQQRLDLKKADLIAYCHGEYYTLGKKIGKFGYSSSKKERNRRTNHKQSHKKQKGS